MQLGCHLAIHSWVRGQVHMGMYGRCEGMIWYERVTYAKEHLERAHIKNYNPRRTHHVCLYMDDPREPHFYALKRILWYVRGTLYYGLKMHVSKIAQLATYMDADWATLSRSSVEAEYRGVANVVAETPWLRESIFKRFCKYLIGESSETNAESPSHAAYPSKTGAKAEVRDQVAEMFKGGSILKCPSNDLGESSEFFYLEISLQGKGEHVTEFSPETFVAEEESLNDKNGSYVAPILVDFLVKEFRCFPRRHVAGDNVVNV
nr:hypothetical protein [Tanacetum cinerariifolium]